MWNSNGNINGTFIIEEDGEVASSYSYGGFDNPGTNSEYLFNENQLITFKNPPNSYNSIPEEENISYITIDRL